MRTPKRTLTNKEKVVYDLILKGYTGEQIGSLLGISYTTVDTHRSHIKHKLDVDSVQQLLAKRIKELEDCIEAVRYYINTRQEDSFLKAIKEMLDNGYKRC